ncbi:MAG: amidophosphoribosyltransferase [Clostridia bacterium]|nr:amidophosphoribosyltransferase [Clostridia bacterium]
MGGYFGAVSSRDVTLDVFYGTDYHSHLGTKRGGMALYGREKGFDREIHNIENSPFRTKFETSIDGMSGTSGIGCISDSDPQPLLIHSNLGTYAVCFVGKINNADALMKQYLAFSGGHFDAMTGGRINSTELLASMVDQKSDFVSGLNFAQDAIEGSASILILKEDGSIIASRDKLGRTPLLIGKDENGHAVAFESFAYEKLGYETVYELGPGEIVEIRADGYTVKSPAKEKKCICAFLWTYYGFPNSCYEGVNVEHTRNINGHIMAREEAKAGNQFDYDYVCGVPDSGIAHAIGYANECGVDYARPFIKYTPTWPRSFMPGSQKQSSKIAEMKLISVTQLIKDKKLLFVDDSIVRGNQLRKTGELLYSKGAKEVHMRSACPPIMYGCKYLAFARQTEDRDLIARKAILELEGEEGEKHIEEYSDGRTERGKALRAQLCRMMNFDSLEFQNIEGILEAIGLDEDSVCTYCWNGKE